MSCTPTMWLRATSRCWCIIVTSLVRRSRASLTSLAQLVHVLLIGFRFRGSGEYLAAKSERGSNEKPVDLGQGIKRPEGIRMLLTNRSRWLTVGPITPPTFALGRTPNMCRCTLTMVIMFDGAEGGGADDD